MDKQAKKKGVGASAKKPSRSTRVVRPNARATAAGYGRSDRSRKKGKPVERGMTKAQRHTLYKGMLGNAKNSNPSCGFCLLLSKMGVHKPGYVDGLKSLPELYAQKPKVSNCEYWWPMGTWKPRIKALRVAIKASAPAIAIVAARPKGGVRSKAKDGTGEKRGPKASPNKSKPL